MNLYTLYDRFNSSIIILICYLVVVVRLHVNLCLIYIYFYLYYDHTIDFPSGDGFELVKLTSQICKHIVCVFPKNISRKQIIKLMKYVNLPCQVEKIHLYSKHKLTVLYFGPKFKS